MRRACVIGWPIEHSRSPLIHGYWLDKYAIDGSYTKVAVRPEELERFLASLADNGFRGCNVTVPHKETAYRLAVRRQPSADAVAAANTLWLEDGKLCAANTDTYGFMTYLGQRAPGWRKAGAPVAILGAGGAARAVAYGFLEAGVGEVRVFNRSRERSRQLAHHFGPRIVAGDWNERQAGAQGAAVLVNTTTLGMHGAGDLAIDVEALAAGTVVADIVYVPLRTPLLKAASAAGLPTVDGLGMLLHQAVPAFETWFGVRPEVTDELYARIAADIGGA